MPNNNAQFAGESPSTIDAKGRTCIPARFREPLTGATEEPRFIITKAAPVDLGDGTFGRGLSIYPPAEWESIRNSILANEGNFNSAQLNSIKRQIINPAEECSTDKLGRVLIPASLRGHASLDRDIFFVGMGRRLDIWSKESYGRINAQDEKNFPIDSEALALLGI